MEKNGTFQTSWIPEKFAIVGKFLKLKEDNGWQVKIASSIALEEQIVNERSRDYTKTREASDI